jgi:hypothetical protein
MINNIIVIYLIRKKYKMEIKNKWIKEVKLGKY